MVHDQQKYATFKGNVKAVQGTTTLRSKELDVHYAGSGSDSLTGAAPTSAGTAAAPAATDVPAAEPNAGAPATELGASAKPKSAGGPTFGEGNQITKIEAHGDVIITSGQDQTTTSDWALYDVPAQLVTVGGNVVLTQGKNVLKGDRLVTDLKTGESRFENTGSGSTGGKIRALFMPKQDAAAKDGKPGNGEAGKDTAGAGKAAANANAEDGVKPAPSAAAEDSTGSEDTVPQSLFPGLPH